MAKQIIDLYKTSRMKEKNASAQAIDFIKPKVGGQIAVNGFTPNAVQGITDFRLDDKVLEAARKGKVNAINYTSTVKK
jgi:hypothetical protein